MRLSEIQNKDIISLLDGKKIGNIIDINVEASDGKIDSLIVEPTHFFKHFFKSSSSEFEVHWADIEKIGEDVILVKLKM